MALVTILSEDNFTSQFYVKRGGDSTKAVLLSEYPVGILSQIC